MMLVPTSSRARCVLVVITLTGCSHLAPHVRNESCDPDIRLSAALAKLEVARSEGVDNGAIRGDERVFIDSGHLRNEIARLALEFPSHVPTLYANALLSYETGEPTLSVQYADRVLALDPRHGGAAALRGRFLLDTGNLDLCLTTLERDVERIPDHASLREAYAAALGLAGDDEGAERELSVAEQLGAIRARVLYHRGWLRERRGDRTGAIECYRHALAADATLELAASRLRGLEVRPD
jgi:tetratricopeptide (TPR) repeat protein